MDIEKYLEENCPWISEHEPHTLRTIIKCMKGAYNQALEDAEKNKKLVRVSLPYSDNTYQDAVLVTDLHNLKKP